MPSIKENRTRWQEGWDRRRGGESWSRPWGSSRMQWTIGILPRVGRFLPSATILEIGPGYGRWSVFLRPQCRRLILVDLSQACVDACAKRFGDDPAVSVHLTDGSSLDAADDRSVDLAFSYDSLVHADRDAMEGYLREMARVLTDDGWGFVHHSNLGRYRRYFKAVARLPRRLRRRLQKLRLVDRDHWRSALVDAAWFREQADAHGLQVVSQELIPLLGRRAIDCISVLGRSPHAAGPTAVWRNRGFNDEIRLARRLTGFYGDSERTEEDAGGS